MIVVASDGAAGLRRPRRGGVCEHRRYRVEKTTSTTRPLAPAGVPGFVVRVLPPAAMQETRDIESRGLGPG
jgi:hypothetical protein